jgi:hypothetical protein
MQELQRANENLVTKVADIQDHHHSYQVANQKLQTENQRLQVENQGFRAANASNQTQLTSLRAENKRLVTENKRLIAEKEHSVEEVRLIQSGGLKLVAALRGIKQCEESVFSPRALHSDASTADKEERSEAPEQEIESLRAQLNLQRTVGLEIINRTNRALQDGEEILNARSRAIALDPDQRDQRRAKLGETLQNVYEALDPECLLMRYKDGAEEIMQDPQKSCKDASLAAFEYVVNRASEETDKSEGESEEEVRKKCHDQLREELRTLMEYVQSALSDHHGEFFWAKQSVQSDPIFRWDGKISLFAFAHGFFSLGR